MLIGIPVYDQVDMLDVAGPHELFSWANYDVELVAEHRGALTFSNGFSFNVAKSFAAAGAYDRYRPRYPIELFDDIINLGELKPGAIAIEIGAGTGIATGSLISHGLRVVAIDTSPAMCPSLAKSSAPMLVL